MDVASKRPEEQAPKRRRLAEPTLAGKVLVGLLIVASALLIVTMAAGFVQQNRRLVKKDQYQAVFLTNGQVYFGKLSSVNNNYVVLKDIYYLQQDQTNVQNQQAGQQNQSQNQNLKLVRLGNELHGPENEMYIGEDKILFWENLKNDGKVVQTIKGQQ